MLDSTAGRRLCVATPLAGNLSETFVRRHVDDLLPGQTALLTVRREEPSRRSWDFAGPCLELLTARSVYDRAYRLVQKKVQPSPAGTQREIYSRAPGDARRIVRFLKDNGVEAIMVEFLDFMLPFLDVVKDAGIRWYSNGHGYDISKLLREEVWVERYQALNRADGVFVRADVIRDRMIGIGISPEKLFTIPCGIDVPAAPPAEKHSEHLRLLAVGRMVPKKAPLLLLSAFEQALEQSPNMVLEYVGGGPLFEAASALVEARGLKNSVILHGPKPPTFVAELLAKADIFVQHSICDPETGDEEGLPVAITEAMALALPVVSTRHAGIPEAVAEEVSGFLVDEGDVVGMADGIARLANDAPLRRQMGLAGFRIAGEKFAWETERSALLKVMGL
jgi:glycosyltransferase involved in cell wall biosynthesis